MGGCDLFEAGEDGVKPDHAGGPVALVVGALRLWCVVFQRVVVMVGECVLCVTRGSAQGVSTALANPAKVRLLLVAGA